MKRIMGCLGLVALLLGYFGFMKWQQTGAPGTLRTPAQEGGYCIALRGNGESEPAHWGALAKTVEQLGLPSKMAGGSSATISIMLMEAIASHPLIKDQPLQIQKERSSLLLKSLLGFFGAVEKTQSWGDLTKIYGIIQQTKDTAALVKTLAFLDSNQVSEAYEVFKKGIDLGLLDPATLQSIKQAFSSANVSRAKFLVSQLMDTVAVFGKFDAQTDDNLFFRAGIVNFTRAADTFGKIASFYAGQGSDPAQMDNWKNFMQTCAAGSVGLTWSELAGKNPACVEIFGKLFQAYYADTKAGPGFETHRIGAAFPVYPTTAVLTGTGVDDGTADSKGTAVTEWEAASARYQQEMDPHFGAKFHLKHPDDIRFGYWGDPEGLQRIRSAIGFADAKSRRFLALGSATWKQVLSVSPAEPGLSPMKEFTAENGTKYVSAGGWSDLQPVLVLKAAGCSDVVYLTRTGGDSIFGQGVAKRLFGFERDWSKLSSSDETKKLNANGDPSDMNSLWSQLFNLANPNSSYARSLAAASAVLCTNWDAYAIQKDFIPLIEDSYRSSFWINPDQTSLSIAGLSPVLTEKKSGCSP
jgi:hypothetical protein